VIGAPSDQPWSVGVLLLVVWRDELRRTSLGALECYFWWFGGRSFIGPALEHWSATLGGLPDRTPLELHWTSVGVSEWYTLRFGEFHVFLL